LKHVVEYENTQKELMVTPHTGVWIETLLKVVGKRFSPPVTPHTGVWIETSDAADIPDGE